MPYRLHKETPQLRIKIEEPNREADNLTRDVWEDRVDIKRFTTPSNNSQMWAVRAAPSHSLSLDRKSLGMANKGEHHHTHPLKQRTVVKVWEGWSSLIS